VIQPRGGTTFAFFDYQVVGVYLWAVLHERPVSWACDSNNWPKKLWNGKLPSQATMSRRLRTTEVQRLLHLMQRRLATEQGGFVFLVDGKPLLVGGHSKDREATWGKAGKSFARGYKLHAIYGSGPLPIEWELAPLNVSEPDIAAVMIGRFRHQGYVVGDKSYDSNVLHGLATAHGCQLLAQQKRKGSALGHRPHTYGRLRCFALLRNEFGKALIHYRDEVERQFGWLTNHSTGLGPLPAWVRRPHRVRTWVQAKLLVHAMYVHLFHTSSPIANA
jgi:hypothetical protein